MKKLNKEQAQAHLHEIGGTLKSVMPPNYGFIFIMTEMGEQGNLFYVSSIKREEAVKALNEFLERATSEGDYGKDL